MNTTDTPTATDLQALLGQERPRPLWRRPAVLGGLVLLLALAAGVWWYGQTQQAQAIPRFVTEPVRQGDVSRNVSADGTLQPTRQVNVGSELSGTVREVRVDVNDRVKAGQVLVVLDTAKLQDQVTSARAALATADAQVAQARATLAESRAQLARQEEVARLSGGRVPSAAELDAARAAVLRAEAAESSALAGVQQARATLSTNETNLAKASIRSPIDGVVLSRSVDPGNAVAASLQAVTLFTIAQDLRELSLEVYVDEADVGAVQVGQQATFTVSAYPNRRYPAQIRRVDFGSTKTDNVVTYVTVLDVDNRDLSLRPGMTASASILAQQRQGVLLVPNAALRFNPASANGNASANTSVLSRMMPRPPSTTPKTARPDSRGGSRQLWVLKDGQPVALPVVAGITDGRVTEVSGEGLQAGMEVITGQLAAGAAR